MATQQIQQRWYPTTEQLKDPAATQRAFRQLLDQHYNLVDKVNGMGAAGTAAPAAAATPTAPANPTGPSTTHILGIPVEPVDTQVLADGTKLTFVKKSGTFKFL